MIRAAPFIAFTLVLAAPRIGTAQERSELDRRTEQEAPRPTGGSSTTMGIHAPTDTEVMSEGRGIINPQGVPTFPLEEPLDPTQYTCGRGDSFELNFWGAQNFKLRVTVDLEGRTFIPKVGYLALVGKSLAEARTIVKQAVHRYYPGLNFDMSLSTPRTFLVHIVGYVGRPGIYPATPIQRLTTVLSSAGNLNGSHRRIEIKHRDGKTTTADLVLYEFTGDTKYNPHVMDGDVITVPPTGVMAVLTGAVHRPGAYELVGTKDVAELLELGGGFKTEVTRSIPIRVIRRNEHEKTAQVMLPFPANGSSPNMALHDEDSVLVPSVKDLQESILLIGPVQGATPADEATAARRFAFVEGMTVRTLLEMSGPVATSADLKHAFIRHPDSEVTYVDIEALLVHRDFSADRPIGRGDALVIPQRRLSVSLEGALLHPGVVPLNPAFRAAEYVALAGGARKDASGRGSYRIIGPNGHLKKYKDDMKLEPGDVLVVPERTFSTSEVVTLIMGGAGILLSGFTLVYLVTR
jgi:protein involved in polysaccharide export with SLBB domain